MSILTQTFLPSLNERFKVCPASEADVHQAVDDAKLASSLTTQKQQVVGPDHCVSWHGQVLQLNSDKKLTSLAGKRVTLRQALDDTLSYLLG